MSMPSLPTVTILAPDFIRLGQLARAAREEQHPVADFLFSEIQRARVVDKGLSEPGAVALNRWVTYSVDWTAPESRILVHPDDCIVAGRHLSVLSPLGAALIGLKVGDRMPYMSLAGLPHLVSVNSLEPPVRIVSFRPKTKIARPDPDDDDPIDPGPFAA